MSQYHHTNDSDNNNNNNNNNTDTTTQIMSTTNSIEKPLSTITDTYRLMNGEGDGLSGLAIDIIGYHHIVIMSSAIWCEIYRS